jgi:hypothetical protein
VESADFVSKNPHDTSGQQALTAAQQELGSAVQRVLILSEDKDTDVTDAMADLKLDSGSTEASVLQAAQSVLDDIANSFSTGSADPQKVHSSHSLYLQ